MVTKVSTTQEEKKPKGLFKKLKSKATHHHSDTPQSSASSIVSKQSASTTKGKKLFSHFRRSSSIPTPGPAPLRTSHTTTTTTPVRRVNKSNSTSGHSITSKTAAAKNSDLLAGGSSIAPPRSAKSAPKLNILNVEHHGLPSIQDYETKHKEKEKEKSMVFNPYGLKDANQLKFDSPNGGASFSVDPTDDTSNLLPLPISLPNEYLPPEFQLEHQGLFEDYEFFKDDKTTIGTGASASVKKVHRKGRLREVYALKKFVLFKGERPNEFYERASKEYIIHRNLFNGLHIVKCYALVKIPHELKLTRGWGFILELCKTDLYSLIEDTLKWKGTPKEERLCIFKQIAYGVKYIHECDIVHRDLKPENILLSQNGIVKITDFGVSDYGHEVPGDFQSSINMSTLMVGSAPYNSPEVQRLKDVPVSARESYNSFHMDHWGLGMILFVIFMGTLPFVDCKPEEQLYREYELAYERFIEHFFVRGTGANDHTKGPGLESKFARCFPNKGLARLAWRLCDPKPTRRYTMFDLFSDPAFQQIEMCIEENDYGCNFFHHEDAELDSIKYEYGDVSTHTPIKPKVGSSASVAGPLELVVPPRRKSMLDVLVDPKDKTASTSNSTSSASPTTPETTPPSPTAYALPAVQETNNEEDDEEEGNSSDTLSPPTPPTHLQPQTAATTASQPLERSSSAKSRVNSTSGSSISSMGANGHANGAVHRAASTGKLTRHSSQGTLSSLCTMEGLKEIKLKTDPNGDFKVLTSDIIKKCGCCKISKHHQHVSKW